MSIYLSFKFGYIEAKTNYSQGWDAGYRYGIIRVAESLHNIKDAQVYFGNLNVNASNIVIQNCIFLCVDFECAINIDEKANNVSILGNNIIFE